MWAQGIEYRLVGEVTLACCSKASVERHAEVLTLGVVVLKYLGGTAWSHGVAARGTCAYAV
jgi:hypothetical protein